MTNSPAPLCRAAVRRGHEAMETYYLYFVGPTGRFVARENIRAEDDAQAIAQADRRSDGRAMELWLGPTRVKTYPRGSSAS